MNQVDLHTEQVHHFQIPVDERQYMDATTLDWRAMFCSKCPQRYPRLMGITTCHITKIEPVESYKDQEARITATCNIMRTRSDFPPEIEEFRMEDI